MNHAWRRKKWGYAPSLALFVFISLTCLYPFYFMIISSFKTNQDYTVNPLGLPKHFTLASFSSMFAQVDIFQSLVNSVIVVCGSLVFILLFSSMAGYAFAKLKFWGANQIFILILSTMMVPVQIIIVPLYVTMANVGLVNNYWSVILLYTTISIPFGAFLMRSFYRNVPSDLMEAAMIDGLSYRQMFFRVMLPLSLPALVTLGVLDFINLWNDLLISLIFLQDPTTRTVTVTVAALAGRHLTNYPMIISALCIATIPEVLVFVIFQKFLIKGVTAGVSK